MSECSIERERERERESVCVCVRERERERGGGRENQEMVHAFPGKERDSRRERRGRERPTDWQRQKLRETRTDAGQKRHHNDSPSVVTCKTSKSDLEQHGKQADFHARLAACRVTENKLASHRPVPRST